MSAPEQSPNADIFQSMHPTQLPRTALIATAKIKSTTSANPKAVFSSFT